MQLQTAQFVSSLLETRELEQLVVLIRQQPEINSRRPCARKIVDRPEYHVHVRHMKLICLVHKAISSFPTYQMVSTTCGAEQL